MNSQFRASMALALTLIGAGVGVAPPSCPGRWGKVGILSAKTSVGAPKPIKAGGGGPTNTNPEGPACPGGPVYRRVVDPDSGVPGWRAFQLALYYQGTDGEVHGYTPGQDKAKDGAFPGIARKLGLRQLDRASRRALHRAEKARYKAIVAKRGTSLEGS